MITAITLENVKGVSEPVTIPLRPLTIMFGKNSAGKSTVIQAIHYARKIFERNNINADRTVPK
jgi:predicted ATPase